MRPTELVPGNCYFSVGYFDDNLLFPGIQTLVYVRVGEDAEDGRRMWIFRDVSSGVSDDDGEPDEQIQFGFPDEQLYAILDFPGLIRVLEDVAVDHPRYRPEPAPRPASEVDLGDLRQKIEQFFQMPEPESVTITIAFTDDGLSLGRRPDGSIDLSIFPRTRLHPAHEIGLRAACLSHGLTPRNDYLSDGGRTRVLVYPIRPNDVSNLAKLAARIFLDVYGMRRGDALRYQFRSANRAD